MKKFKNFTSIVLALVMALTIVAVPVFAVANNPFAVDTDETPACDAVEGVITNDPIDTEAPADKHQCTITQANENWHRVNCECGEYYRVRHNELKPVAVNSFFHVVSCTCGYTASAEHNFGNEYDADSHWEYCIDCGFTTVPTNHTLTDDFWGNTHEIWCGECGFTASRHTRVTWVDNGDTCTATCHCGASETISHEWDGFECYNCEHELVGPTGGIVEEIVYNDYYELYYLWLNIKGESHCIELDEIPCGFGAGDFIIVNHWGNDIGEIEVMVLHEIINDPTNAAIYVNQKVYEDMVYVDPSENIVTDIFEFPKNLQFQFDIAGVTAAENYAVVYDFVNGEYVNLTWICEGERLLWFWVGNTKVFLSYGY